MGVHEEVLRFRGKTRFCELIHHATLTTHHYYWKPSQGPGKRVRQLCVCVFPFSVWARWSSSVFGSFQKPIVPYLRKTDTDSVNLSKGLVVIREKTNNGNEKKNAQKRTWISVRSSCFRFETRCRTRGGPYCARCAALLKKIYDADVKRCEMSNVLDGITKTTVFLLGSGVRKMWNFIIYHTIAFCTSELFDVSNRHCVVSPEYRNLQRSNSYGLDKQDKKL